MVELVEETMGREELVKQKIYHIKKFHSEVEQENGVVTRSCKVKRGLSLQN